MELRLLQSFLVLSQELHFGRAAVRLHIAQPPLTKQIHQLEKQLGVQLFERHPRGVRLTPAGEALVVEAERIFSAVETAEHHVRHADHGGAGRLILGFSGATGTALVPGLLRAIGSAHPGIDLDVKRYANSLQVADGVVDGKVDLGHVLLPFEHAELSTRPVACHQPVLVVGRDHPLADRRSIHLAELEEENFITPRRYSGSALLDLIHDVCNRGGFSPRVVKETPDSYTTLMLVAGGLGVSITVTGVDVLSLDVRYIPFADEELPALESAIAWRTKNPSRLLETALHAVAPAYR
jgi:DNA-binding transcriptional LysR family regulator